MPVSPSTHSQSVAELCPSLIYSLLPNLCSPTVLSQALLKRTMPDVDTMTLELHVAYITAQRTFKRVDKDVLMRRAMASEEAVLLNA